MAGVNVGGRGCDDRGNGGMNQQAEHDTCLPVKYFGPELRRSSNNSV